MKPLTRDEVTLGFIGLGNMGSRIARRLLRDGYRLIVYDRDRGNVDSAASDGASVSNTLAELSRAADAILSCVTDDEAVRQIYYGEAGVLANARAGAFIFEMSTVFPDTSRDLYRRGAEKGIRVLDVAISGSTPAAEAGSLILLVGGDEEVFEAAQPLFNAISPHSFHLFRAASRSFYMGPAGAGTTMKLVVNTLLGVGMQAIAEAIPLGEKAGIDRNHLLDVLSQTAVIAPAHAGKLARAAHQDYSPQFPLRLMNKDFRLILEEAKLVNVQMPATVAAFQVNSLELAENPDADFSAVIRRMEELADTKSSE
jgi:3-hydroxyisobutyrate dehydrogenase-like beta-hydroxyacid dehydrogenase